MASTTQGSSKSGSQSSEPELPHRDTSLPASQVARKMNTQKPRTNIKSEINCTKYVGPSGHLRLKFLRFAIDYEDPSEIEKLTTDFTRNINQQIIIDGQWLTPLIYAIKSMKFLWVKKLLHYGANVTQRCETSREDKSSITTALHVAIKGNAPEPMINLLLRASNLDLSVLDGSGNSPADAARTLSRFRILEKLDLIRDNSSPSLLGSVGALIHIVREGKAFDRNSWKNIGFPFEYQDCEKEKIAQEALFKLRADVFEPLTLTHWFQKKTSWNLYSNNSLLKCKKLSPAHILVGVEADAGNTGKVDFHRLVYLCRSYLNCYNENGHTPLHINIRVGNETFARILIQCGANFRLKTESGISCLQLAIASKMPNLIQHMIDDQGLDSEELNYKLLEKCESDLLLNPIFYDASRSPTANSLLETGIFKILVNAGAEITDDIFDESIIYGLNSCEKAMNTLKFMVMQTKAPFPLFPTWFIENVLRLQTLHDASFSDLNYLMKLIKVCEAGYGCSAKILPFVQKYIRNFENEVLEIVQLLISKGMDVDSSDLLFHGKLSKVLPSKKILTGNGALIHLASFHGYIPLLILLLKHKADVNLLTEDNKSALYYATAENHIEVCRILIEHNANLELKCTEWQQDILDMAIFHSSFTTSDILQLLLQSGCIMSGLVDIQKCVFLNNFRVANQILSAEPDLVITNGDIIFNLASLSKEWLASNEFKTFFRTCLDRGFNINGLNGQGSSLVHEAIYYNPEFLRFLIREGAVLTEPNAEGFFPIHLAIETGDSSSLELILKQSNIDVAEQVNQRSLNGLSPLHLAICKGNNTLVAVLIENGAPVFVPAPLDSVISSVNLCGPLFAKFLLNCEKAEVLKQLLVDEITPLQMAYAFGNLELIEILINAGSKHTNLTELHLSLLQGSANLALIALRHLAKDIKLANNKILGVPCLQLFAFVNRTWDESFMELVQLFIERGYDLNLQCRSQHIPPFLHSFISKNNDLSIFDGIIGIDHLNLNVKGANGVLRRDSCCLNILLKEGRSLGTYMIKKLILACCDASVLSLEHYKFKTEHSEILKLLYSCGTTFPKNFIHTGFAASELEFFWGEDENEIPEYQLAFEAFNDWLESKKKEVKSLQHLARIAIRKREDVRKFVHSSSCPPRFKQFISFENEVKATGLEDFIDNLREENDETVEVGIQRTPLFEAKQIATDKYSFLEHARYDIGKSLTLFCDNRGPYNDNSSETSMLIDSGSDSSDDDDTDDFSIGTAITLVRMHTLHTSRTNKFHCSYCGSTHIGAMRLNSPFLNLLDAWLDD